MTCIRRGWICALALLVPSIAFAAWRIDDARRFSLLGFELVPFVVGDGGLVVADADSIMPAAGVATPPVPTSLRAAAYGTILALERLSDGGWIAAGRTGFDTVYVVRANADGSLRWHRRLAVIERAAPSFRPVPPLLVVSEATDRLFIALSRGAAPHGSIMALDLAGHAQWTRSDATLAEPFEFLLLDSGRVVAGGSAGCGAASVIAFEADDGSTSWTARPSVAAPDCISSLPRAVASGASIVVSYSTSNGSTASGFGALRLDAASGAIGWQFRDALPSANAVSLVAAGADVVLAGTAGAGSSAIVRLAASTGQVAWRQPLAMRVIDVVQKPGALYVAGDEPRQTAPLTVGRIARFDDGGAQQWSFAYSGALASTTTSMRRIGFDAGNSDPLVFVQGATSYRVARYVAASGANAGETVDARTRDVSLAIDELGDGTFAVVRDVQDATGRGYVVRRQRRDDGTVLWERRVPVSAGYNGFAEVSVRSIESDVLLVTSTTGPYSDAMPDPWERKRYSIHRINGATGVVTWSRSIAADSSWLNGRPSPDQQVAIAADGSVYWAFVNAFNDGLENDFDFRLQVQRIDGSTGTTTWLEEPYVSEGLYVPDVPFLAATSQGVLLAGPIFVSQFSTTVGYRHLRAADGQSTWSRQVSSPSFWSGGVVAGNGDLLIPRREYDSSTPEHTSVERIDPATGTSRWIRDIVPVQGTAFGVYGMALTPGALLLSGYREATGNQSQVMAAVLDPTSGNVRSVQDIHSGTPDAYVWQAVNAPGGFALEMQDELQSGLYRIGEDGMALGFHAFQVHAPGDASEHDVAMDLASVAPDATPLARTTSEQPMQSHVARGLSLLDAPGDLVVALQTGAFLISAGEQSTSFTVDVTRVDALPVEPVSVFVDAAPAGVVTVDSCTVTGGDACTAEVELGTARIATTIVPGQVVRITGKVTAPADRVALTTITAVAAFRAERPDATPANNVARKQAPSTLLIDGFE